MKISSTAGELEVIIKDEAKIVDDTILLHAQMGVWNVQIYLGPGDFRFFFSFLFSRTVLTYLIKLLYRFIFRHGNNKQT